MSGIEEGMIIQERYKILQKIGEGGMSEIYLVEDERLGRNWALKCVDLSDEEEWRRQAYEAERRLLVQICHPAFPMLVDSFCMGEQCCLVMEWLEGENLEDYLIRNKRISETEAKKIMSKIMEALSYLHRQTPAIVYGDLKPANIILQRDKRVRLLDFGSAVWGEERFVFGTPEYAAPEQFSHERTQIDQRSDIYAVGVLYAEILTGQKKQYGFLQNPFLPKYIRRFIQICTMEDPEERFQTMEEAIAFLTDRGKRKTREQFIIQDQERILLIEDCKRNRKENKGESE